MIIDPQTGLMRRAFQPPVNLSSPSFDGANTTGARQVVLLPYDSRQEIRSWDRRQLTVKSRSMHNNLGFLRGIVRTTKNMTVGWGNVPVPRSSDRYFNQQALAYWKRWANRKTCDIRGKHNHAGLQRQAVHELLVDGEIFTIRVRDQFGRHQRQMIKTEQVGPARNERSKLWVDGILYNAVDRPTTYRVLQNGPAASGAAQAYRDVPARDMAHLFDAERATQQRGLPWAYAGLNSMMDVLDLSAFERIAHKLNAAIVASVTTKDGSMPASMRAMMSNQEASAEGATSAERTRLAPQFLDIHGTRIPLFNAGENLTFNSQQRNAVNVVEFTGWLLRDVATGFGLPLEVVWDMATLGGATIRASLEMAGRFFESVQMLLIDDFCQPDWESVIGTALLAGLYPADYPLVEPLDPPKGWEGWNTVEWRGPRNITVDRGKDGRLYLEQVARGMMTKEEWWHGLGEDAEEMERRSVDEIQVGLEDWVGRGLPEAAFWLRLFGQAGASVSAGTAV